MEKWQPVWQGGQTAYHVGARRGDASAVAGDDMMVRWHNVYLEEHGPLQDWEVRNGVYGTDWVTNPTDTIDWGRVRSDVAMALVRLVFDHPESARDAMRLRVPSTLLRTLCITLFFDTLGQCGLFEPSDIEVLKDTLQEDQARVTRTGQFEKNLTKACDSLSLLWTTTPNQSDDLIVFLEKALGAKPSLIGYVGREMLGAAISPLITYLKYGVVTAAALGALMGATMAPLARRAKETARTAEGMSQQTNSTDGFKEPMERPGNIANWANSTKDEKGIPMGNAAQINSIIETGLHKKIGENRERADAISGAGENAYEIMSNAAAQSAQGLPRSMMANVLVGMALNTELGQMIGMDEQAVRIAAGAQPNQMSNSAMAGLFNSGAIAAGAMTDDAMVIAFARFWNYGDGIEVLIAAQALESQNTAIATGSMESIIFKPKMPEAPPVTQGWIQWMSVRFVDFHGEYPEMVAIIQFASDNDLVAGVLAVAARRDTQGLHKFVEGAAYQAYGTDGNAVQDYQDYVMPYVTGDAQNAEVPSGVALNGTGVPGNYSGRVSTGDAIGLGVRSAFWVFRVVRCTYGDAYSCTMVPSESVGLALNVAQIGTKLLVDDSDTYATVLYIGGLTNDAHSVWGTVSLEEFYNLINQITGEKTLVSAEKVSKFLSAPVTRESRRGVGQALGMTADTDIDALLSYSRQLYTGAQKFTEKSAETVAKITPGKVGKSITYLSSYALGAASWGFRVLDDTRIKMAAEATFVASEVSNYFNSKYGNDQAYQKADRAGAFDGFAQAANRMSMERLGPNASNETIGYGVLSLDRPERQRISFAVEADFTPNETVRTQDLLNSIAKHMTTAQFYTSDSTVLKHVQETLQVEMLSLWATGAIPSSQPAGSALPESMSYTAAMHLKECLSSSTIRADAELTGSDSTEAVVWDKHTTLRSDFASLYNTYAASLFQENSFPYQGNLTNVLGRSVGGASPALFFDPTRTDTDGAHYFRPQGDADAVVGTARIPSGAGIDPLAIRVIAAYFPRIATEVGAVLPSEFLEIVGGTPGSDLPLSPLYEASTFSVGPGGERLSFDSGLLRWVQQMNQSVPDETQVQFKLSRCLLRVYNGDYEEIFRAVDEQEFHIDQDRASIGDMYSEGKLSSDFYSTFTRETLNLLSGEDISDFDRIDALVVNFPTAARRAIMYSDTVLAATNATLQAARASGTAEKVVVWAPPDTQADASAVHHGRLETQRRISEAAIRTANGAMELIRLQGFVTGNSIHWHALGLVPSGEQLFASNDEAFKALAIKIDGVIRANNALYQMWSKMVLDLWKKNANGGVATPPSDEMVKVAGRWAAVIDDKSLSAQKLLALAMSTSIHQGQLVSFGKNLAKISEDATNLSLHNSTLNSGAPGLYRAMQDSMEKFKTLNAQDPAISRWYADKIVATVRADKGTNGAVLMLAELFSIPENSYLGALAIVESQYGIKTTAKASYVLNAAMNYDRYVHDTSLERSGASVGSLGAIYDSNKRGDMNKGHEYFWDQLTQKVNLDKGVARELYDFASLLPYGGALGMLNTILSDDEVAKAQLLQDINDRDKMIQYIRATTQFVIDNSKDIGSGRMQLTGMVDGDIPSLGEFQEAEKWVKGLMTKGDNPKYWGVHGLSTHTRNATTVLRYANRQKLNIERKLDAQQFAATAEVQPAVAAWGVEAGSGMLSGLLSALPAVYTQSDYQTSSSTGAVVVF
jgi:hypothetical protein